jgi:hypothetical protein
MGHHFAVGVSGEARVASLEDAEMMATATVITDDLDGSANAQTVTFSFDGTAYTIDLGKKNRAALEKALKPYLAAATKVSRRSTRSRATGGRGGRSATPNLADVRAWASAQGIAVSDRGRIARDVLDAYAAAH